MPIFLSGWANLGRGFRAKVCQYFAMVPVRARRTERGGQGTAYASAATALAAVDKPMRAPDVVSSVGEPAVKPQTLAVSARSVSLTFQTADGEVQALSNVDLDV